MTKDIFITLCRIISALFVSGGIFFFIAATVGVIRMPDSYNRGHTAGKGDSPAFILCLAGCWMYWFTINWVESIKIILIIVFMLFANPIAIHSILRVCYKTKCKSCKGTTFELLDKNETVSQESSQGIQGEEPSNSSLTN